MAGKPAYTAQQMIDALTETKGLVSLAARRLGCHPDTVRAYIKRYPTVAQAKHEAREALLDTAELSLYNQIVGGEAWAVQFALRTIGKDRGYVERQEQDQRVTGNVKHEHRIDLSQLSDDDLALAEQLAERALRSAGDSSGAG